MERREYQPAQESAETSNQADRILADFGVSEGEPIPDAIIRDLIKQNEAAITEGLSRNWYHPIKKTLYEHRVQPIHGKDFVIVPVRPKEEKPTRTEADFILFLEPDEGDRFKRNDGYKLIVTCSADTLRIQEEENKGRDGMLRFIGTDAFSIDHTSTNHAPMSDLRDRWKRQKAMDVPPLDQDRASYQVFKEFLEKTLRSPEQFPEAAAQIDAIFSRYSFSTEDAEKLKRAIWEFGNYDYKTRKGFEMIGDCLVVPGQFESFVEERYGIELQRCELSGAHKRRENYTPEERAELAAERAETDVHEASIYQKTAIIDWTSRQFSSKLPLPEIVDLNEDQKLQERIEIS